MIHRLDVWGEREVDFNVLPEDYDWQNPKIFEKWLYTADKIEREPALLSICIENIARWKKSDGFGSSYWLKQWRPLIERAQGGVEGMKELLVLLRDDGERARQWKSASPFPGVLSKEERRQFTCAWTH